MDNISNTKIEKYSLRRMLRTASRYRVDCYGAGEYDDPTISKTYKTYKGASAFALKWSRLHPSGRVELLDVATDRDYYEEDTAASQVYVGGELERDGLPMGIRDRINQTGGAVIINGTPTNK